MCTSPSSPDPYPSDLTDPQWALVEPLLPSPNTGGRHERHPCHHVVGAIVYVGRTGCAWRQLPRDFPPWQTVYRYFAAWSAHGTLEAVPGSQTTPPELI
jgi:transposase